jgi:Skp family chaperone for outer membrane proteins
LAKPNFEFQKRQKELEKKRKKEEKKQKKLDRAAAQSSTTDTGPAPPETT